MFFTSFQWLFLKIQAEEINSSTPVPEVRVRVLMPNLRHQLEVSLITKHYLSH